MIDPNTFLTGGGGTTAKFPTIGTTVTGTVASEPRVTQQVAFGTNEPLTWSDGSPRLQLVVELSTSAGIQKVYIKGQLKNAVAAAVSAAGKAGLEVGGSLTVTYTGDAAPARPGIAGAKQYSASYTAPAVTAQAAVLGTAPVSPPVATAPPQIAPPVATAPPVADPAASAQAALAALSG